MAKNNFTKGLDFLRDKARAARTASAAKKSSRPPQPKPKWVDSIEQADNAVLRYGAPVLALVIALVLTFFGVKSAVATGIWWYPPLMVGLGTLFYVSWGVTDKQRRAGIHFVAMLLFLAVAVVFLLIYRRSLFSISIAVMLVSLVFMHNVNNGVPRDPRKRPLKAMAAVVVGVAFLLGMERWLPSLLALSAWNSVWLVPVLVFGVVIMVSIAVGGDNGMISAIAVGLLALIRAGTILITTYGFANSVGYLFTMIFVAALPAVLLFGVMMEIGDSDW